MNMRHQPRVPTAAKDGKRSVEPRLYVRPLPPERAKLEQAAAMVSAGGVAPFLLAAGLAEADRILTGEAAPVTLAKVAQDLAQAELDAETLFFTLRHARLRLSGRDAAAIARVLGDEGQGV